ncbi:uncharacterized protein TM35_000211300 [Trypanosoma theileri]|uniref:Receptor-type adenylate cyclase n=1 Tax=Trypanosoma theileri TaxID=67003 RepID=A0A1X0NS52_9TRYP|nr:uncharacterized protein TM35_000211300 [Trypanosoma theileri]ORC87524.1 hypothetical protein TM35_000211300 [Trypanosoma theileri]
MIPHPNSVYHHRHGRELLPLLLLLLLLVVWKETVEVYAVIPDNDKMLVNVFPMPFACILTQSPTNFSVDIFLQSLLDILVTLPGNHFSDFTQMELLEYCAWGNLTLTGDSYCRNGGKDLGDETNFKYTLVRYGVMADDLHKLQQLNYTPLGVAVGPILQHSDPALYVPGENDLSFGVVVFSNETVVTIVSVFLLCIFIPLMCIIFICRHVQNVRKEKVRAELVRHALYELANSGHQEQEQQQGNTDNVSRNNQDGERVAGREMEREMNEVRWGGRNIPLSVARTPSYWPSSTNAEEIQRQQGREWYERELAPKPSRQ